MTALRRLLGENLLLKAVSLVLAVLAWVAVQGERTFQRTVVAPVEYVLPPELVLLRDEPPPAQVIVTASGTRAALNKLRKTSLSYLVDLERAGPGRTVHSFRAPPAGFPPNLIIDTVSPAELELEFDERTTRTVTVQLRTRGSLPTGFVNTEATLQPEQVTLVGSRAELKELEAVRTVPFRLADRREDFEGSLPLDLAGLHLVQAPTSVGLTYRVQEAQAARDFGEVPIRAEGAFDGAVLEPATCIVRIEGPVPVLEALGPETLRARLVGDPALLGENGARVPWAAEVPERGTVVHVSVRHERADELTIAEVEPRTFAVAFTPTPTPPSGESEEPETPGKESP